MTSRPCPCGSGLDSSWQCDARGIELARTCRKCHKDKMAHYRRDIFANANYWHDEPIEDE